MRLSDDGTTVTLDLHRVRVGDAEALIRRTVALASERGRASVRVIHGSSTSNGQRRTIKGVVHNVLDQGMLAAVTGDFRAQDYALLSLGIRTRLDTRRLTLNDVW
ncbi:MAG: Smr/MutS family protein [Bacteroidota bacterium]